MRGKVFRRPNKDNPQGITPAYAGKSTQCLHESGDQEDHPRLCGEKLKASHASIRLSGSPPPMRGKDEFANGGRSKSGITPAYAGKREFSRLPMIVR